MIRVVIDTSVLIRYLIKPGAAIKELIERQWLTGQVQMVTAPELVAELEGVLGRESIQAFIRPAEGQVLLDAIRLKASFLPPLGPVPTYTRDPKDDKFVACALVGDARYVITVDQDILVLGSLEGIQMVTPYEFLSCLDREQRR